MPTYAEKYAPELIPHLKREERKIEIILNCFLLNGPIELTIRYKRNKPDWYKYLLQQSDL